MENLNEVSKTVHANAVNKGFYDLPNRILQKMEFLFEPEEVKAVKDAFIAQRLMLITSELSEALEANRNGRVADMERFNADGDFKSNIKDTFSDELADSIIRIGDLAGWLGIDLQTHVELKHKYNTGRAQMHGGKAY